MIERLRYFLKEGFRSIWVNRMMSIASILVLCICLVMLGTTYMTSININNFLAQLESKNQIMVYLNKDADDKVISSVGAAINGIENVKTSTFLTKDQIFAQAKETLGEQKIILSGIDSSAFDSAYQVELKDLSKFSETTDVLQKIDGVKYVRQDEALASTLTKIEDVVSKTGFWLFIILAVISIFIISNTIKLALFSRKREINIMKYVGATDWFIRSPFIIEGLMIGIISGGIALLFEYFIYTKLVGGLIAAVNISAPIAYGSQLFIIIPGFLIGGSIVGILGSILSLRKYLRV